MTSSSQAWGPLAAWDRLSPVKEECGSPDEAKLTLEGALDRVGTGKWQLLVLLICGLGNAADAVEILSIGLVLPAAENDLALTHQAKAVLSSCIFLGMLVGGLVWGHLGDAIGRKWTLVAALILNGTFGALSAGVTGWRSLALMRFISGIGVGGSVPIVFAFMAENCCCAVRGRFLVLVALHWMLGSIYSAATRWILISSAGWRVFLLMASLPALFTAVLALLLARESPRHLCSIGQVQLAESVLSHAASWNGTLAALEPFQLDEAAVCQKARCHADRGFLQHFSANLAEYSWHLKVMFSASRMRHSIALIVAFASISFGWYGTSLWIPTYFERRQMASSSEKSHDIYFETLVVALANFPGNMLSVVTIDWLGRRKSLVAAMAGGALSVLGFAFAPSAAGWAVAAAAVFNGISVVGWNALDVISTEMYPTAVRTTALGLVGAVGRVASALGSLSSGELIDVALWLPMLACSLALAIGCAAACFLPETNHLHLIDHIEPSPARASPRRDLDYDEVEMINK